VAEVFTRFGSGSPERQAVTARLKRIYDLAIGTGGLDRLILFGSYVSETLTPNDVDLVLVMRDDFRPETCPAEALGLFDHHRAAREFQASVFWIRPSMQVGETLEQFIDQTRRQQTSGDKSMIRDDRELTVTQDRIAYFHRLLGQLRVTARPEEFALVASGYRAEVERMQQEVLDFLTRHASQTVAKAG
jgi:hypothetical protein